MVVQFGKASDMDCEVQKQPPAQKVVGASVSAGEGVCARPGRIGGGYRVRETSLPYGDLAYH
jgi:hypothetical protein